MSAKQRKARETFATSDARFQIVVTDDGSRTVVCRDDGQSFHSESGAIAEAKSVYLENSGVLQKFKSKTPVRIFELGFGFGLNFFVAANFAMELNATLEYVAVENRPVPNDVVQQLALDSQEATKIAWRAWLNAAPNPAAEDESLRERLRSWEGVSCCICECDFSEFDRVDIKEFDTIFFDPFSPESNPELWSEACFGACLELLASGGTLVTYCVKRSVQDALKNVGFRVEKKRGPQGGKREVLVATKDAGRDELFSKSID